MTKQVTETFFLPDEIDREASRIPADIYHLIHHLQSCSDNDCVFVPIRTLQAFGIITEHEIVFVDSMRYAHIGNEGGRVIMLSWVFRHTRERDALDAPVDCDVIYYRNEGHAMQSRLVMEFRTALENLDKLYRQQDMPAEGARIIRLNTAASD